MKKLIVFLLLMTVCCYCLDKNYVYTSHKAYIYKFIKDNEHYCILFNDTHNNQLRLNVDSATFYHLSSPNMRKRFFHLEKYDDGRIVLLE